MAFVVQTDGPVVLGANSYVAVAFFRAFLDDEGIDTAAWGDDEVQGALVSVTRYAEGQYPWIGQRTTDDADRLHFPAAGAVVQEGSSRYRVGYVLPDTAVPLSLKEGLCWLALAQLESGKRINELRVERSQVLKRRRVDVIEKEWESPHAADRFPAAERCFAGLWQTDAVAHARLIR